MTIGIPEKLALTLFLVVAAVTLPWNISALLIAALLSARTLIPALRPLDQTARRRFRKIFFLLLSLVAVMTAVNSVLVKSGEVWAEVAGIRLFEGGLLFGLTTGCRLLLIASAFLVLFGSTSIGAFADYLNHVGIPGPIATTALLSLHFLDHLPERIQQIFIAQESRGAPLRGNLVARIRSFFLLLSPLVLSSIVESIERGMALELRGFHLGISLRTASGPEHRHWSLITVVLLAFSIILVVYQLALWLIPSP